MSIDDFRPPTVKADETDAGKKAPRKLDAELMFGSSAAQIARATDASRPPPTDPVSVTRAMIDLAIHDVQQIFPKQFLHNEGGNLSLTTYDENKTVSPPDMKVAGTTNVKILINHTDVPVAETLRDAITGERSIVVPTGKTPEETTRLIARALGDIYATAQPGAPSGIMKELDAISLHWNQASVFAETGRKDGDALTARVWQQEASRLEEEFRTLAVEAGVVPATGDMATRKAAQTNREAAWSGMSDNSRMLAVHLAPGARYPSFIPGVEKFRVEYNALDNLVRFLETVPAAQDQERFAVEAFPRVADVAFPDAFKVKYKSYLPSISSEGPLDAGTRKNAASEVRGLTAAVHDVFRDVADWATRRGVLARAGVGLDQAVSVGEQRIRQDYQQIKGQLDQIVDDFGRQHGIELGYVGSMRLGQRGPHKAGVHADLYNFDLDLYVVDKARFDVEYVRVMSLAPDLMSRGKILPDRLVTPELKQLSLQIAKRLSDAFPGNVSLAESEIALRREAPYRP